MAANRKPKLREVKKQLFTELDHICKKHRFHKRVYKIRQSDFINGTFIIDKPGVWKVVEDITLHFNPDHDFMPLKSENRMAFILGFFAGIVIECEGVCLDLCGHTIAMSQLFALEQRFFSIIELASAPFIPKQGPGDFGSSIKSASYTIIKNGTIGRSSHHGIHGNGAHHIIIKDLIIKDFEVAGIALNGGNHLAFECLDIGPNWKDVPVLGNYSAARFIPKFCHFIMGKLDDNDKNILKSALNGLMEVTTAVRKEFDEHGEVTNELFGNPWRLPDGNNYGLLIHPPGVAVNDYTDNDINSKSTEYVFVNKVNVHDIEVKVNEIIGISKKDGGGVQADPSGSVIQISHITGSDGKYKENVLSKVQILLGKLANKYDIKAGKLNIAAEVISWAESNSSISDLLKTGFKYKCNGDSMHHVAKPVHGFRFDGIRYLEVRYSEAVNIGNIGYFGAMIEVDAERPDDNTMLVHHGQIRPGYRGSSSIGWNFSHVISSSIKHVKAKNIYASNGDATGFRFINGCNKIKLITSIINRVLSGLLKDNKWYYIDHRGDNKFFKFHSFSSVPDSVGVKVEDDNCLVTIKCSKINGLKAPGCKVPIWLSRV